jgi:ubiquinone/menaquinone biosynthesis C-methylase UbiE
LIKKTQAEERFNEIYSGKGYSKKRGFTNWLYSKLKQYKETRTQAVVKLLDSGERLLDVGCGNGNFCIKSKDYYKEIFGIDVSSVRIEKAKEKISQRKDKESFNFSQHDIAQNLPFKNEYFDTVTCIATLECLTYPKKAVAEMKRVLKPGGILIVTTGNIAFLPHRLTLLSGKLPTIWGVDENGIDWDRLHSFTRKVFALFLKNQGLEIVSLSCSGIFSRVRKVWPSLLAGDIIAKARKSSQNREKK